jgi:hypothetical protein
MSLTRRSSPTWTKTIRIRAPLTTRTAQSRCRPLRKSGTEPTLDETLREPAIRLIMRWDNVTEDQLLYLINMACRHING